MASVIFTLISSVLDHVTLVTCRKVEVFNSLFRFFQGMRLGNATLYSRRPDLFCSRPVSPLSFLLPQLEVTRFQTNRINISTVITAALYRDLGSYDGCVLYYHVNHYSRHDADTMLIRICMTSWFTFGMPSVFFVLLLHAYTVHNIQFWPSYKHLGYFRIPQSQVVELSFKLSLESSVTAQHSSDSDDHCHLRLPLILFSYTSSASATLPQLYFGSSHLASFSCSSTASVVFCEHFSSFSETSSDVRCQLQPYLLSFSCSLSASAVPPQPQQHFISFSGRLSSQEKYDSISRFSKCTKTAYVQVQLRKPSGCRKGEK